VLVYLIRHGESVANTSKIMQGQFDSPLSEFGIQQAKALNSILPKFDCIYSSPLSRAFDTSLLATGEKESNIVRHDGLMEMYLGDLEGKHVSEIVIPKGVTRKYIELDEDAFFIQYKAESIEHFVNRTAKAFDEIIEEADSKKYEIITIFNHGGVMRCILQSHLKLLPKENASFENTEVVVLQTEGKDLYNNRKFDLIDRTKPIV